MLLTFTFLVNF